MSPECENVDLRSQLFKRDNELSELKATLNETLRKVGVYLRQLNLNLMPTLS